MWVLKEKWEETGMKKQFLTADDVSKLIGRARGTANRRIQKMNAELKEQGYYTEPGMIPVVVFQEKYKGIEIPDELLDVF